MPAKLIVQLRKGTKDLEKRGIRGNNKVDMPDKTVLGIVESESEEPHPWDQAHEAVRTDKDIVFAEPDVEAVRPFYPAEAALAIENEAEQPEEHYGRFIKDWTFPAQPDVWHIRNEYTQLEQARLQVANLTEKKKIRIAHLDTGYDEEHESFPGHLLNLPQQYNAIEDEEEHNAEDRFITGLLRNPGHGAGTLSILAGEKMPVAGCPEFNDYVGLKEAIEIVPIRVAKSVVLFRSAAFVRAMDYILNVLNKKEETRIHVITMSMGGLASRAWADMVNEAYDQGVFMVTAAGNNFAKLPTSKLVFPARFNRVVAACGATFDFSPYAKPAGEGSLNIMEGNHGPLKLMDTAIAAYTPNVPWAVYKHKHIFGIRGDGTSSATPQIAAAAALYYSRHYVALEKLPEPWMRVEAIRHALFSKATKDKITGVSKSYKHYYGNGLLRAADALEVQVPDISFFTRKRKQKKDKVFLPLLRVLLGLRRDLPEEEEQAQAMLETELRQLAMTDPDIQRLLDKEDDDDITNLNEDERMQLVALVLQNPAASNTLRERLQRIGG